MNKNRTTKYRRDERRQFLPYSLQKNERAIPENMHNEVLSEVTSVIR